MGDAIVGPISPGTFLLIDPDWIARHPGGWRSPLGPVLPFIFIDLEDGIEESAAVNYADIEVIGRAESYKSFIGAGNREFPLTFKFRAQGAIFSTVALAIQAEVMGPALWLDALKQPFVGEDGLSHAPPPCFLSLGLLFFGRVVATDVQISWQPPFEPLSFLPHGADVTCTFTVVRARIKNYSFGVRR